jgi:hypothetical protein
LNQITINYNRMDKNRDLILKRHYFYQNIKMMNFFKKITKLYKRLMIREWRSMIKLFNILKLIIRVSLIWSKNGISRLILTIFQNINLICWDVRRQVTANLFLPSIKNDNFLKNLIRVNKIWKRDWRSFIKV